MRSTYARDTVPLTPIERDLLGLGVPVWCCSICRRLSTTEPDARHRAVGVVCPGVPEELSEIDRAALLAIRMGGKASP